MKRPGPWRDTIDPFTLPYRSFKPLEILGYPHAGNDVFYVRGLYHGRQINAYIKAARQRGADIGNEISILSQLRSPVTPAIVDSGLDGTPFIVTQALPGERLSTIVGENAALESLSYLEEYGAALARIHQLNIQAERVKDRKFFHAPPDALLEALQLEDLKGLFPSAEEPANTCFCHGDFHYANILWEGQHISGILDFELAGYGNKEFDTAWAVFWRPGQSKPIWRNATSISSNSAATTPNTARISAPGCRHLPMKSTDDRRIKLHKAARRVTRVLIRQ